MIRYLFFALFLIIMIFVNRYVYYRFLMRLHFLKKRYIKYFSFVLIALHALFIIEIATKESLIDSTLFYVASSSIGVVFLLFITALLYDILHTTAQRITFDPNRRKFIKLFFDITMLIVAFSYVFKGIAGGIQRPIINRQRIFINDFPFKDFSIAQLSDVHIGHTLRGDFLHDCVERINELHVDMVVITGDLVDLTLEAIKEDLTPLKELKSTYGTFYILGNHEYFHGAQEIVDYLRALSITPLLNESVAIGNETQYFNLVGINDLVSKRMEILPFDIQKAYEDVDPTRPTIVLAHQPKMVQLMTSYTYDLMISGHTHGGQIFPFGALVMLDQTYLAGLYDIDAKKQIYVSSGTGYWGPPIRVFAPSEIGYLIIN